MNKEQKAAAVAEIADQIEGAEAVFAIDYRGITVAEIGELRGKLREADTTFRVVKNTLTERAADKADAEPLKAHLEGPTALAFVRGDAAAAAKAIADFQKASGGELLPFKGGLMNGAALDAGQITAISKLPSRDVLYGQLVGMIASPITGLARGMNGLLSGLAVALGGVLEGAVSAGAETVGGSASAEPPSEEAPAGDAPAAEPEAAATEEAPAEETTADAVAEAEEPAAEETPAEEADASEDATENDDSEASADD